MYTGLLHAHSGLRWIVLVLILWAIIKAFSGWMGGKEYTKSDRLSALFALIFTHIQLLLGLVLYFVSPKVQFTADMMKTTLLRFYTMEHLVLMLVAIVLITMGFSKAKRLTDAVAKHKKVAIYYGIGLLLILAGIPWPFRGFGAGWF
ncbi:cytochrome B [Gracilimonas mengyeensis]|uniref:Cytochrome B n=1 Tax=Gracilimonas mengyeensis TaxID=1302730 RepID=A0A521FLN9_9BACT|nr:cytochrome B [Gracilimonas mengyeensis]SMO97036.1 hypothetical protein SAMN06265219_12222 [Gracilimonas mengyeensis]